VSYRRAARIDSNQPDIVKGLRKFGAGVTSMAPLGGGVSDLLVSFRQRWYVMEVKTEDGDLTPDQVRWIGEQRAPVYTVRSLDQAVGFLATAAPDWLLGLEVKAMRDHVCEGPGPGDDEPMAPPPPRARAQTSLADRVLESLRASWRSDTKMSVVDLCDRLVVSKTSKRVEKALRSLIREGLVHREGNNRCAVYWAEEK
jgi:hypothetical protein